MIPVLFTFKPFLFLAVAVNYDVSETYAPTFDITIVLSLWE